jgi:hypothetical protein
MGLSECSKGRLVGSNVDQNMGAVTSTPFFIVFSVILMHGSGC